MMKTDGSDVRPIAAGIEVTGFSLSPDGVAIIACGHAATTVQPEKVAIPLSPQHGTTPAHVVPAAPKVLLVKEHGMAPLSAIATIAGAKVNTGRKEFDRFLHIGANLAKHPSVNAGVYTVTLGRHTFQCAIGEVNAWHNGMLMNCRSRRLSAMAVVMCRCARW